MNYSDSSLKSYGIDTPITSTLIEVLKLIQHLPDEQVAALLTIIRSMSEAFNHSDSNTNEQVKSLDTHKTEPQVNFELSEKQVDGTHYITDDFERRKVIQSVCGIFHDSANPELRLLEKHTTQTRDGVSHPQSV